MNQENIRVFGKLGIADLLAIGLGASACSNFASLFTRNPQTIVYLALIGALLGALAIRYGIVSVLRYIDKNFGENPKKVVLVRIAYTAIIVVVFFANFFTKIALENHIAGRG